MFKASAGKTLPTSIIGSLPRPSWYTAVLGTETFLEAMLNARYREQYEDAVSVHLRAQETAGLDICTDGDAHYDDEIGGMSWQGYPMRHMAGFDAVAQPGTYNVGNVAFARGHILHDYLEARVFPKIVGPVGPGNLQYAAMWKVAQRLTTKPVKFGSIMPELLAAAASDSYYKDPVERVMALSDALNAELHALADAGCPVIQMEEPQIHMVPARGKAFGRLDAQDLEQPLGGSVAPHDRPRPVDEHHGVGQVDEGGRHGRQFRRGVGARSGFRLGGAILGRRRDGWPGRASPPRENVHHRRVSPSARPSLYCRPFVTLGVVAIGLPSPRKADAAVPFVSNFGSADGARGAGPRCAWVTPSQPRPL